MIRPTAPRNRLEIRRGISGTSSGLGAEETEGWSDIRAEASRDAGISPLRLPPQRGRAPSTMGSLKAKARPASVREDPRTAINSSPHIARHSARHSSIFWEAPNRSLSRTQKASKSALGSAASSCGETSAARARWVDVTPPAASRASPRSVMTARYTQVLRDCAAFGRWMPYDNASPAMEIGGESTLVDADDEDNIGGYHHRDSSSPHLHPQRSGPASDHDQVPCCHSTAEPGNTLYPRE
jgi:hypothetical protein